MIILYGTNGSPYVSRVRMQIYAKELPFEQRPAVLGSPEYLRMSPLGKMPLIEHDGLIVPESAVIAEYIEDVFPTPSLLGATAQDRMRARLIVRAIDLYCAGVTSILRAAADPSFKTDIDAKRAELNKGLDALDTFLDDKEGYAVGGALSLADCAVVPWFYYGNKLTQGGDDSITRRTKLARYLAFISEQPLAKRILGEMDEAFQAFMARWKAEQAKAS